MESEVAHAMLFERGEHRHGGPACEEAADAMARGWGFVEGPGDAADVPPGV